MHNGGTFSCFLKTGLWAEAANAAMLLENKSFTYSRDSSPFFEKGKKNVLSSLQKFEEMHTVSFCSHSHCA